MYDEILREPQVKQLTKLARTTRWRLERAGQFPKRRQLGANSVGWLRSEIDAWIKGRALAEPHFVTAASSGESPSVCASASSTAPQDAVGIDKHMSPHRAEV